MSCLRILNEKLKRCNGNKAKFAFYFTKRTKFLFGALKLAILKAFYPA